MVLGQPQSPFLCLVFLWIMRVSYSATCGFFVLVDFFVLLSLSLEQSSTKEDCKSSLLLMVDCDPSPCAGELSGSKSSIMVNDACTELDESLRRGSGILERVSISIKHSVCSSPVSVGFHGAGQRFFRTRIKSISSNQAWFMASCNGLRPKSSRTISETFAFSTKKLRPSSDPRRHMMCTILSPNLLHASRFLPSLRNCLSSFKLTLRAASVMSFEWAATLSSVTWRNEDSSGSSPDMSSSPTEERIPLMQFAASFWIVLASTSSSAAPHKNRPHQYQNRCHCCQCIHCRYHYSFLTRNFHRQRTKILRLVPSTPTRYQGFLLGWCHFYGGLHRCSHQFETVEIWVAAL